MLADDHDLWSPLFQYVQLRALSWPRSTNCTLVPWT
jgi:hypothetical protein